MYTELHLHDYYSTLDGLNSPAEYMVRAKELGMTHLAQTNHGTLIGLREFQREAKNAGITPILGVEAYISATDRFDRRAKSKRNDGTNAYNHIILLAQDEVGLQSLFRLNEIGWTEGFYSKPRIDLDALEEHNEGIIALSGCLNGLICKALERGDWDGAVQVAHRLKSILGDRFFIEVQGHNPKEMNDGLFKIADTMNIMPVVTSDCHYARKEDLWLEEAMLILSTKPKPDKKADFSKSQKMEMLERFNYLYPNRTMTFEKIEIYLRSAQEQLDAFPDRPEVVTNTKIVADMIGDYPYHQGLDLLPLPKSDPMALLRKKVYAGMRERGHENDPLRKVRVEEEFGIIEDKGFPTYFLIVANMVQWAKRQGIRVGPGRGSGAGSLINLYLGITEVDPIPENLLFFRFINPERNDFPDIDTDFEDRRRNEVKEYLRRQFKNVASIATVNKFQGKNSIKDAARVFQVPIADVNRALKGIDAPSDKPHLVFEQLRKSDKGEEFIKKYPEVLSLAEFMAGRIRGTGMHAAGMVLSKEPISNFVPIETAKEPNSKSDIRIPLVALDMEEAADVGLIKLDALGLKCLSIIDDAIESIEQRHGRLIVPEKDIPYDDANVYKMLSEGYTKGVFQCEAVPYTNLIIKMGGVNTFAELAASNALVRPGAMNTIGAEYIARKNGKSDITYPHEVMKAFTEETYGEVLYQEQVMLTMTELAGMSMATADKVRKIIGKKKDVSEFDAYRDEFVAGASEKVTKKIAEKLWHDFEAHAGYSFNKSHAVAYSMLSYWTAWLKYHYPLEFMWAVLRNETEKDALTEYLIETKRLNIKVLLPHVEKSDLQFTIENNGLRFGLTNIKFISDTNGPILIGQRPFGSYKALEEKVMESGNGLNVRVLQGLNAVGAASYPDHPKRGDERNNFYEYLGIPAFETKQVPPKVRAQMRPLEDFEETGCFAVLGMVKKIKRGTGWSRVEIVDETGTAGVFHIEDTPIEPGQMYAILVADNRVSRYVPMDEITPDSRNTFVRYLFDGPDKALGDEFYQVVAFQSHTTKGGKKMAYLVLADGNNEMHRVLAFPQMFHQAYSKCQEGAVIMAQFGQTDDGTVFLEKVM